MRKLIIAGMAVAMLAIPAVASADVPRYQTQDATITVTQPYGGSGQWQNGVWTHDYTVEVNPCDSTFTGTGDVSGPNGVDAFTEDVKGTFNNDGTVSLTSNRAFNVVNSWSLANAPMNGTTMTLATTDPVVPYAIEMKVSAPVFTNTSTYKNHGEYVKAMGGGSDAAHSCIGMPINSNK